MAVISYPNGDIVTKTSRAAVAPPIIFSPDLYDYVDDELSASVAQNGTLNSGVEAEAEGAVVTQDPAELPNLFKQSVEVNDLAVSIQEFLFSALPYNPWTAFSKASSYVFTVPELYLILSGLLGPNPSELPY